MPLVMKRCRWAKTCPSELKRVSWCTPVRRFSLGITNEAVTFRIERVSKYVTVPRQMSIMPSSSSGQSVYPVRRPRNSSVRRLSTIRVYPLSIVSGRRKVYFFPSWTNSAEWRFLVGVKVNCPMPSWSVVRLMGICPSAVDTSPLISTPCPLASMALKAMRLGIPITRLPPSG